ncbi:hypothetical protein KSS87_021599 [Heliosperma pusillum]|nr:hypothetical protein KSS87_021599 [Heliosperma pusillum]
MAQLHAFAASSYATTNLLFNAPLNSGVSQVQDKLFCTQKTAVFEKLGAKSSEFRCNGVLHIGNNSIETQNKQGRALPSSQFIDSHETSLVL